MAGLGNFSLVVGVDTSALSKGLASATTQINTFAQNAERAGTRLSLAISTPLALLAKKAIESYGELEALKMSLKTVEGTAANTARRLAELNEVAKLPGIGFKEAIQADVRLRSVGISADIAKRSMLAFGNAIAIAGGGKEQFNSVLYQLTQMSAKSKVLSQDFRPIIEAVPAVAQAVKKLYGTVDTEAIQDKMAKAKISSQQFIEQIIAELETLPKVTGGIKNAIENFGDTLFKTFAKVGETIDKNVGVQKWIERVGVALEEAADGFSKLSPEAQKAILAIAGIAIVLPPFLALAGTILPAISTGLIAIASPAGVAGAALVAAAVYAVSHWNKVEDAIYKVRKSISDFTNKGDAAIYTALGNFNGVGRAAADLAKEKRTLSPQSIRDSQARQEFMYKKGGDRDLANQARLKAEADAIKKQKDTELQIKAAATDAEIKKEQERVKKIKDLNDNLIRDTARANAEAIQNKAERARAMAQLEYQETTKSAIDSINELKASNEEKKALWDNYAKFAVSADKKLQAVLKENNIFAGIDFKQLKSKTKKNEDIVSQLMGISPDGVDKYAIALNQKIRNAAKYLEEQGSDKTKFSNLEKFLGLNEGVINGDNFRQYATQAEIMIDANQRIKESFQNMAAESLTSLSAMIGEMMVGTATIQDLAGVLLSTLSNALANVAKQSILAGVFSLNLGMIAKGVLAGIGAGIFGGLAKRNQQQDRREESTSILRGQDIQTSVVRYNTIKNF